MNSQYTFDKTYLLCVAQHMDQILPCGEVPQKMASSVKKTFLSSRAMYKAVQSAFDIADKMKSVSTAVIRYLQRAFKFPAKIEMAVSQMLAFRS